jgi:ribosomal-protein-alanine N-acetyltransferase
MEITKDLDVLEAVALHQQCFGPEAWSAKSLYDSISDEKIAIHYGAYIDDKLIGLLIGRHIDEEAEILTIAVHCNHRQKGVSKALMDKLLADLKEKSVKTCFLEVAEDNLPAINLYKRYAFDVVQKRHNYYPGNRTAIVLVKNISKK